MIKFQVNEDIIFNKDQSMLDLARAMANKSDRIDIDLNGEGPCLNHVGLYQMMDNVCEAFGYPKSQVHIHTSNFLEEHPEYQILREHQNYELAATKQYFHLKQPDITKNFGQGFKYFGHFIGHSNSERLRLASYLYSNHLDKTLQTYHCDVADPYHRPFIGLEDMLFSVPTSQELEWAMQLIRNSPIKIDPVISGSTIGPSENLNISSWYPEFFVELVSLTFFKGNTFYIDEKIWRPMIMKTPFMVQGPSNLINNLHRLGFKTFNNYWDEAYSEDPWNCQVPAIINNINRIAEFTLPELKAMYIDMSEILDHNHQRVLELTNQDFKSAFGLDTDA